MNVRLNVSVVTKQIHVHIETIHAKRVAMLLKTLSLPVVLPKYKISDCARCCFVIIIIHCDNTYKIK